MPGAELRCEAWRAWGAWGAWAQTGRGAPCAAGIELAGEDAGPERGGAEQWEVPAESGLLRPLWAGAGRDPGYIYANRAPLRVAAAG